jgi:hypothetical protein
VTGASRSAKDKSMAGFLKDHGVVRGHTRCPICHGLVPTEAGYSTHLRDCTGRPAAPPPRRRR